MTELTEREKTENPPRLFDLTELQREANRRHGFSAAKTLELAQKLYEQDKVLSYPRTDSRFLSNTVTAEAVAILVVTTDPGSQTILETALARPRVFGRFLFERYWLSVEIVSFLLLIALVGVLYLGKAFVKEGGDQQEDQP